MRRAMKQVRRRGPPHGRQVLGTVIAALTLTSATASQDQTQVESWLRDPGQRDLAEQAITTQPRLGIEALKATDDIVRDQALAVFARNPRLLIETGTPRVTTDAARIFADGRRDVREPIGMLLRSALAIRWPRPQLRRALDQPAANSAEQVGVPGLRPLAIRAAGLALSSDPAAIEWLLADHPDVAYRELQSHAAIPTNVQNQLLRRFTTTAADPTPTTDNLALCDVLLKFESGRAAIRANPDQVHGDARACDVRHARADCDLSADAQAILLRWTDWMHRDFPTVLRALGPAADQVIPELRQQLAAATPASGEPLAAALCLAGDRETPRQWLRQCIVGEPGWMPYAAKTTLEPLFRDVVVEMLLGDDPKAVLPTWHRLHDRIELAIADRTAVALRLLGLREAGSLVGGPPIDWPRGLLGPAAEGEFAEFFRRAKTRSYPDRLVDRVAAALLPSYPTLAINAIRGGAKPAIVLAGLSRIADPQRLAGHDRALIEVARNLHQPPIAHALGATLGNTTSQVTPFVLPLVDAEPTRVFACHFLAGYGPRGAAAIPRLNELARSKDHRARFVAAHALAHLGPTGVARVAILCNSHPELLSALERAATRRDPATVRAACHGLLSVQPGPNANRANALRQQLNAGFDPGLESLLLLTLLAAEPAPRDTDWLRLAAIEPAILRRRAVEALSPHAQQPLHLAVLAELLDDPVSAIAEHAATTLLQPLHAPQVRRALAEFGARSTTAPELAARIQLVLDRGVKPGKGATSRDR